MSDFPLRRVLTEDKATELKALKVPASAAADWLPTSEPYRVVDEDSGAPLLAAWPVPRELSGPCVAAFRAIGRATVVRSGGIRTSSNTFGYSSARPVFQRSTPSLSAWLRDDPEGHASLETFAAWAWPVLLQRLPEVAQRQELVRSAVHTDWRMGGTGWTSGIANDTVPLYYHRDRNNFPDSWSVMLAARAGTRGGDLHLADYDLTVPIRDGWAYAFPGVNVMHGVTPIRSALRGSFRYTFVWYPVKAFGTVGSAAEARTAAANRRTELEAGLIERQREHGMLT